MLGPLPEPTLSRSVEQSRLHQGPATGHGQDHDFVRSNGAIALAGGQSEEEQGWAVQMTDLDFQECLLVEQVDDVA